MSASLPSITAVIPTYNRAGHVVRAVKSVLAQDHPVDQTLVIDDGSTDDTVARLRKEFGDSIDIISQANAGVSAARRAGIENARGEWVAFLDSDDEWTTGRNRAMAQAAAELTAPVGYIFGDMEIRFDDSTVPSNFARRGLALDAERKVFERPVELVWPYMYPYVQSSMMPTRLALDEGVFADRQASSEDFLWFFRLSLRHSALALNRVVTRFYRTGELLADSLSKSKVGLGSLEHHRARMLAFGEAHEAGLGAEWKARARREVFKMMRAAHRSREPITRRDLADFCRYPSLPSLAALSLRVAPGSFSVDRRGASDLRGMSRRQ